MIQGRRICLHCGKITPVNYDPVKRKIGDRIPLYCTCCEHETTHELRDPA